MSSIAKASETHCEPLPRLLITLRSSQELAAVPWWWAAVLDFKEPRHGALGPVDQEELQAIKSAVAAEQHINPNAANTEISVACGDWWEWNRDPMGPARLSGVQYAKLGWNSPGDLPIRDRESIWERFTQACIRAGCRPVPVLYADWIYRQGTTFREEVTKLTERGCHQIFVDTWDKSAGCLSDWISPGEISRLVTPLRNIGVSLGLAGSLRIKDLDWLLPLKVNWLGFRGAVAELNRVGTVTETSWRSFFEEVARRVLSVSPSPHRLLGKETLVKQLNPVGPRD